MLPNRSRVVIAAIASGISLAAHAAPSRDEVCASMAKATGFMMDAVSNRGGFVWAYTEALEPYGELPARPSMIWVEPPSTPSVGIVLLDAYHATDDDRYLEYARRVAGALVWGQQASGGWHYFIDFDPVGVQPYYDNFFSKCWGWQEYLHNYGNCTFDDFVVSEPTRFLMRLYTVSQDPIYRVPLEKALDFILDAQYPNGAWPQRWPPTQLYPREDLPDYTLCYTFNDGVMSDTIDVLLEAYRVLGDERYLDAARRGMDFYLLAQLPAPQAGWAQQYGRDMKPAWGRPFEIGTVCAGETASNVLDLFTFYKITGDRRYLEAVPPALDWLDRSKLEGAQGYSHTYYYEMGTNRPLFIRQTGETIEEVRYVVTDEVEGSYPYGNKITLQVDALRYEHRRLSSLSPNDAKLEYDLEKSAAPLPHPIRGGYLATALNEVPQTIEGIESILASQKATGGWTTTISIPDPFSPFTKPPKEFEGYTTGGYIARMYRLINYLNELETGP